VDGLDWVIAPEGIGSDFEFPRVDVTGAPGRYALQASTNVTGWQPTTSNVSATGTFRFYQTVATNRPVWLYRAEQ
jgi:hypothetical protein